MRFSISFMTLLLLSVELWSANIVFRFDDFTLNHDPLQNQILDCFHRCNVPLSIAVIPFDDNGNPYIDSATIAKVSQLCKSGYLEVCLHGYNHHNFGNGKGEMCGYSNEDQYTFITKGKIIVDSLLDINVVTFIPPFNIYNGTTLTALEKNGFKAISSGLYPGQCTSSDRLNYYPETVCNIQDVIGAMNEAIEYNHRREGIIVCMLHAYDITDDFTIKDLEKFLLHVSSLQGTHFDTYSDLIAENNYSDSKRITANMESNLLTKILKTKYIIQPKRNAFALRLFNFLIYLFAMTVLFIPSFIMREKISSKILLSFYLLSVTIVFITVWIHLLTPLKAMFASSTLPVLLIAMVLIKSMRVKDN